MAHLRSETLQSIYNTAVDPGRWANSLDAVSQDSGAHAAALLVREQGDTPYSVQALSRVYRDLFSTDLGQYYVDGLSHHEAPEWQAINRAEAHEILRDTEAGTARAVLDVRPDYAFLRNHSGINRRFALRLNKNSA